MIARTSHRLSAAAADMALPASLGSVSVLDPASDAGHRIRLRGLSRDHVVTQNGTHVAVASLAFRTISAASLRKPVRSSGQVIAYSTS